MSIGVFQALEQDTTILQGLPFLGDILRRIVYQIDIAKDDMRNNICIIIL